MLGLIQQAIAQSPTKPQASARQPASQPPAQPPLQRVPSIDWEKLEKAVGAEEYAEAKKLAEQAVAKAMSADQARLSLLYCRILLGLGEKEPARQLLTTLGKQRLDGRGLRRIKIYRAWLVAFDGKADAAIRELEAMLDKHGGEPAAEAADVVALLRFQQGSIDAGKKAAQFGIAILTYEKERGSYKGGYLQQSLQGRLAGPKDRSDAKKLYDAAESLLAKKQYPEAARLYEQVVVNCPQSPWRHPAGFRIGQCLLEAGQLKAAQKHWKAFVAREPAGPWRGQAYVALVDMALDVPFDLAQATELTMAAAATLGKNLGKEPDKDAAPSWKDAAYDLHLRHGIVSLVEGRAEAATQAFQLARPIAPADIQPGLDRLIELSKQKTKLLPDELNSGDDPAKVAILLGTTYSLLHQYDRAKKCFAVPIAGSHQSRSAAHRAFARFSMARVLVATAGTEPATSTVKPTVTKAGKLKMPDARSSAFFQARSAYEASLKEHPAGSWHDETLREVALLIERAAVECAPGATAEKDASKKGDKKNEPKLSFAEMEKARQEQAKAIVVARGKALPYWADLRLRYPASPYAAQALYHLGVLFGESEKPDEALAAFDDLSKTYPASPWTGDAQIRLIDVKLEQQFDLAGARKLAEAAIQWYEHLDQAKAAEARKTFGDASADGLRSVRQIGYEIYIRAGVVAYLSDDGKKKPTSPPLLSPSTPSPATMPPAATAASATTAAASATTTATAPATTIAAALAFFEKAKTLQPERDFVVVQGTIPTGIERLIEAAKSGKSLTPDIVRQGDEKARLILMLADVYHIGEQWPQSLKLCDRVITGAAPKATREQKSYAHFKRARNCYRHDREFRDLNAAFAGYAASVRIAPDAPWADNAMFLAANIQWNYKHDPNAAIALWQRLCRTYPKSEEAHRAAYYIGVVYELTNKPVKAKETFNAFLKAFPDSPFVELVRDHHLKNIDKRRQQKEAEL
jgi:outer membrane protein assembly factor BamD (BamD/ComL family)